ncbi:MAG: hypothetical protein IPM54_26925 [Polyangiaceae bacterium]|nr:hypothetical protein [Polyangiaceae bacterium]
MSFRIQSTFEGLVAPPQGTPDGKIVAGLPPEVQTWLEDLMLLRGVPLHYIVPDPRLLPPESIRFFHIDPTWTARLVDGALAAANVGGSRVALSKPMLAYVRKMVAAGLAQRLFGNQNEIHLPMLSGMLIRSDLVRRWPGLNVTALEGNQALTLARKERIASGLMIVIFAGVPTRVEIAEPFEGTRFGVELKGTAFSIQIRQNNGSFVMENNIPKTVAVQPRTGSSGVLDIQQLANAVHTALGLPASTPLGAAMLSLSLQQQPFVQVFAGSDTVETARLQRIQQVLASLQAGNGGT